MMRMETGDSFFSKFIAQLEKEIETLEKVFANTNSKDAEECLIESKKQLEMLLYRYVVNGCTESGQVLGAFPELETQYDTESYELLDKKIAVLSEIARLGVECNYLKIDGFNDILENKPPFGVKIIVSD